MNVPSYVQSYRAHLNHLLQIHSRDDAMAWIVGGQYEQIGILESSLLRTLGLQPGHTLVDIGSGSGRLPWKLRSYLTGKFIGTDILPELLDYAREKCGRTDWEFIANYRPTIPVADHSADFVTFFSVFTHLLDEDIYRFLAEAKRVAKPGGKIVFSFLDFEVESHWAVFTSTLANENENRVLNKFVSKPSIRRFARELGLKEERIYDGPEKWIQLTEPFTYIEGRRAEGTVEFGQSVAVYGT